jgi:hypothetical protein
MNGIDLLERALCTRCGYLQSRVICALWIVEGL